MRYNLDDSVQRVEMSQVANVVFVIFRRVSNNKGAFWQSRNARTELGDEPLDDASTR